MANRSDRGQGQTFVTSRASRARKPEWDLVRGNHQGQRFMPRKQAGHKTAPDQRANPHKSLATREPSTQDVRSGRCSGGFRPHSTADCDPQSGPLENRLRFVARRQGGRRGCAPIRSQRASDVIDVDPSCELPLTRMAQRVVAPELAHVTNRRAVGLLIRSVPRLDSCNQNGALAMWRADFPSSRYAWSAYP